MNRTVSSKTSSSKEIYRLEEVIDIEKQIENFSNNKMNLANPKDIYKLGPSVFSPAQGFKSIREEIVSCTSENKVVI